MNLNELLKPYTHEPLATCQILGLSNDSRSTQRGDLFIAYPGAASDGRNYLQQAQEKGAAAILYEKNNLPAGFSLPDAVPCIALAHLAEQLGSIAARFYQYPSTKLTMTGVTGTNGKTTIAYQLAQAHTLLGQKAAYIGTLGQGMVGAIQPLANTTPDAILLQKLLNHFVQTGIEQVCMEVSSHALHQQRVAEIHFNQAIFTNLSHDHLDYHHTLENYAEAKAMLFATPALQWAIINADDTYATRMVRDKAASCKTLTYGLSTKADVRASACKTAMSGTQFNIDSPWGKATVRVQLLGEFNIYNSLAVFTSLMAQEIALPRVVEVMQQLQASPGRMEVVSASPCVIVDYAHTPDALEKALKTLVPLKKNRLIVVFGCGGDRDKTKRPIMGRVANQYADLSILTSDNPRTEDPAAILDEIAAGLSVPQKSVKMVDRQEAIQYALSLAKDDDIILVAGKGHESYQQIGKEFFPFSDQAIIREWFAA